MNEGICKKCKKTFFFYKSCYPNKDKSYCSRKCYFSDHQPWNKGHIPYKKCIECGVKIRKWRKYCSLSCYYKNVDVSERLPKSLKGELNPNFGKKYSDERLQKMSEYGKKNPVRYWLGKKRVDMAKEKHWNWKGGKELRPWGSSEYALWRKAVYERDEYRCQDCGKTNIELNAHHIKRWVDFPELRYAIDNGISLCVECHYKRHRK